MFCGMKVSPSAVSWSYAPPATTSYSPSGVESVIVQPDGALVELLGKWKSPIRSRTRCRISQVALSVPASAQSWAR